MLREYEFTLIAKPDLSDADLMTLHKKYEAIWSGDGGEILKKDVWGSRKLSYPIKKTYKGHYTIYDFMCSPDNMSESERLLRIDDGVLRYMAVKIGENVNVEERKVELIKEKAKKDAPPSDSDDED